MAFTGSTKSFPKIRCGPGADSAAQYPRKRLPAVVEQSTGSRMGRHREMYDPPALMRQHQKHVQVLEPDRRHG
jgi:hypothetical protein